MADDKKISDLTGLAPLAASDYLTVLSGNENLKVLVSELFTSPTILSPVLNASLSGSAFLDEDAMTSNSAIKAASQQSIKAYVDEHSAVTVGTTAGADYVCDGTADNVQIQAAIDAVEATGRGGIIRIFPGLYDIAAAMSMDVFDLTINCQGARFNLSTDFTGTAMTVGAVAGTSGGQGQKLVGGQWYITADDQTAINVRHADGTIIDINRIDWSAVATGSSIVGIKVSGGSYFTKIKVWRIVGNADTKHGTGIELVLDTTRPNICRVDNTWIDRAGIGIKHSDGYTCQFENIDFQACTTGFYAAADLALLNTCVFEGCTNAVDLRAGVAGLFTLLNCYLSDTNTNQIVETGNMRYQIIGGQQDDIEGILDMGSQGGASPYGHYIKNAHYMGIRDGITAPDAVTGNAAIYVDSADGNLKTKLSDGNAYEIPIEVGEWKPVNKTFIYASATTFTIAAFDATTIFQRLDKIKLTNSGVKYFYIESVVFDDPGSTITVIEDTTYALANAAITVPYYSRATLPFGFPDYLNTVGSRAYSPADQPLPNTTSTLVALGSESYDGNTDFDSTITAGTADGTVANHLQDDTNDQFTADMVGATVWNTTDNTYTTITAFNDSGDVTIDDDIFVDTEGYKIFFSRFTTPITGRYSIKAQNRYTNTGAGVAFQCRIHVDGTIKLFNSTEGVGATSDPTPNLSDDYDLVAGEVVTLTGYQDTGGPASIDGGSTNTFLTIRLVAL